MRCSFFFPFFKADFCAGVISLLVYHLIFKSIILPKLRGEGYKFKKTTTVIVTVTRTRAVNSDKKKDSHSASDSNSAVTIKTRRSTRIMTIIMTQ